MKLDKYFQVEKMYIHNFSTSEENEQVIRFSDNKLQDMYTHNFTLIKKEENLLSILRNEIGIRKREKKEFLRIETYFEINSSILSQLSIKPEISIYDFMNIDTHQHFKIDGNKQGELKEACTKEVLEKGMIADEKTNQEEMGDFAKVRIKRKADIYQDRNSKIKFYVLFLGDEAIGTCEMMMVKERNIAKIEDFDILKAYRRKGFGSFVLKSLLEIAYKHQIDEIYLITDHDDTAKDMYKKCGFRKIGEKYEYFFSFR